MWQANQRHGPGIMVTQAGVCYQGTFQADKMVVSVLNLRVSGQSSPCITADILERLSYELS